LAVSLEGRRAKTFYRVNKTNLTLSLTTKLFSVSGKRRREERERLDQLLSGK
jgi:hypothetical protein